MEDLKTQKKARFQKGSEEARKFMADLRSKRCKCKTPAPAPAPAQIIAVQPKKRISKKNITVDFS